MTLGSASYLITTDPTFFQTSMDADFMLPVTDKTAFTYDSNFNAGKFYFSYLSLQYVTVL